MNSTEKPSLSPDTNGIGIPSQMRIRVGLVLSLVGIFLFMLGARPAIFGLDRSPVVGFVQTSVFVVGMAVICVGGHICLMSFWRNGSRSITVDVGSRLVATGYVIAFFSGFADVFGLGSQGFPKIIFFGPFQALGVLVGELVIGAGFLLMIRYHRLKRKPS